jgi:hypothetical protein
VAALIETIVNPPTGNITVMRRKAKARGSS